MENINKRFKKALMDMDEAACLETLDHGADPRYVNRLNEGFSKLGQTIELESALSMALRWAMPDLVSRLLPLTDWARESDPELLLQAARSGHLEALKAICEHQNPRLIKHKGGVSALMNAASSDNIECAKFLIPLSDLNARDRFGHGPLEFAAHCRSVAMINFFLDAGLPPNPPGEGYNALLIAAERGRLALVERLLPISDLRRGSEANGWTNAVVLALENEHWDCADAISEASPLPEALAADKLSESMGVTLARASARAARQQAGELDKVAISAPRAKPRRPL